MFTTMSTEQKHGISLSTVLFLIFLTLKLTHLIDWSWWWITSPIWVPIVVSLVVVITGLAAIMIITLIKKLNK